MVLLERRLKVTYVKVTLLTFFVCLLFLGGYRESEIIKENRYHVFVNGTEVGVVSEEERAERLLQRARREIARRSNELLFLEAEMEVTEEEVFWNDFKVDDEDVVVGRMKDVLGRSIMQTLHRSYTLKVNEYVVDLGSTEDVQALLQAAVDKYDTEGRFEVNLVQNLDRGVNVLTANVERRAVKEELEESNYMVAGVQADLAKIWDDIDDTEEMEFEDYELGLKSVFFSEEVEIVEAYLPESRLSSLQTAMDEVIKDQEVPTEYTIVSGDTLSQIAIKVDIPMDKIVEMNSDKLENENSIIHVGDTLVVTVPEPELSVEHVEEIYSEEIYDADVIIIDKDEWFTNQTNIIQQPSAGFRKVVAQIHYRNGKEVDRDILKEEVLMEAVPKIMERGTKIPPTYIKPINGGIQSSGFGRRNAPVKGASTYHKGIDWAVPTGTSVYASCGGTVVNAGWGSGYGYVVYINHIDGRQTRYAHLSKVLVSVGQTVKQGERIALSGNTGRTSGPHLHFEMLIGGSQVNPLKYLH